MAPKLRQGMGYAGISNLLAVEFDTHYNPDLHEPYENHVSVQTRYKREANILHTGAIVGIR